MVGLSLVAILVSATPATATSYLGRRPQTAVTAAEECRDLALINGERAAAGVPALVGLQTQLRYYGRRHAREMANQRVLYHDMAGLQAAAPAGWHALGENVAAGMTIEQDHQMYMQSYGHRANILGLSYTHVGIGVWHTADGVVVDSEEFLGSSAALPVLRCPGS